MKVLVLAAALVPAACASAQYQPSPAYASMPIPPAFRLIETPAVKPPANDISEADRRAWFEANRPQGYYVPTQDDPVADGSADCDGCHDHCHGGFFGLPISLGIGYFSGSHGHSGFGVGLNVCGLGVGVGFGGW